MELERTPTAKTMSLDSVATRRTGRVSSTDCRLVSNAAVTGEERRATVREILCSEERETCVGVERGGGVRRRVYHMIRMRRGRGIAICMYLFVGR